MNLNEKPLREKYKEFYGKNTEQMELLIKDNRIPLTMQQIIERRLNSKQDDWKTNYFDTCDGLVQFKGKIKIIKNCKLLKEMTSKTELTNGGIKITEKDYKKLKGKEFDISKIKFNNYLTKEEVKKHPIWKGLLGEYLSTYIELVFPNNIDKLMEVWIDNKELILRAWCVGGLGYGSGASGWDDLGYDGGRLVGIATELRDKT
jgi:hypothetical protein